MWLLTAAQRNLLLGPDIEKKAKKVAPRLSLAELQALTDAGHARREAQRVAEAIANEAEAAAPEADDPETDAA